MDTNDLKNEVNKIEKALKNPHANTTGGFENEVSWTGSKAEAVELLYSLVSKGCINNGNIEIKTLVQCFESWFNIQLPDFYRKYTEIKTRSERTKFLDSLKTTLLKKMEKEDN